VAHARGIGHHGLDFGRIGDVRDERDRPAVVRAYDRSLARSWSGARTATAPMRSSAVIANSQSGIFGNTTITRSPLRMPASFRTAAQRFDASEISSNE